MTTLLYRALYRGEGVNTQHGHGQSSLHDTKDFTFSAFANVADFETFAVLMIRHIHRSLELLHVT